MDWKTLVLLLLLPLLLVDEDCKVLLSGVMAFSPGEVEGMEEGVSVMAAGVWKKDKIISCIYPGLARHKY